MHNNKILKSEKKIDGVGTGEKGAESSKGRGAQLNTPNRFLTHEQGREHIEGIDEWEEPAVATRFIEVEAKTIVNKVDSPDVGMLYSMNPYAGCEHGCIYCYARNTHKYWGYSAGLDFESRILMKKNAPQLLRKFLMHPKWACVPLSLSGNTDCYQPCERQYRLTRSLLEVCREFGQPVGIITKNAGILRDKDILQEMGTKKLASVLMSINSLNEDLRKVIEPRTTTAIQRLRVLEELSKAGVQTGLKIGPVIPGLNDYELHDIIKAAAGAGATFSAYTMVRLNGAVKHLFHDWLYRSFPDRGDKVWHGIEGAHGGIVNDSSFGRRMRGEGSVADIINHQYKKYTAKYGLAHERLGLDTTQFRRPGEQTRLF